MKTKILFLLFSLMGSFLCSAQNQKKIDSLLLVSQKMALDSNKVKNILRVSELYKGNNNQKSKEFALEAIKLAQKIKWVAHYPELYNVLVRVMGMMGNYAEAIAVLDSTIKYTGKQSDCVCYTAEYYIAYLFNKSI